MAELQFNTTNIRRVPINRNNLFYSDESFLFEQQVGKEYIEQDMNQTVVLYEVDLQSTNVDATSGATYSSEGIMAAVEQALNSAKN